MRTNLRPRPLFFLVTAGVSTLPPSACPAPENCDGLASMFILRSFQPVADEAEHAVSGGQIIRRNAFEQFFPERIGNACDLLDKRRRALGQMNFFDTSIIIRIDSFDEATLLERVQKTHKCRSLHPDLLGQFPLRRRP